MSRYRKVSLQFWNDQKVRRLSLHAKFLCLYLFTGPETTSLPGVIVAGRAQLAEALGWPPKTFDDAFAEVSREGLVMADFEARLIWLPKATKHNPPENPNVVKSWNTHWVLVPECDLKVLIYEHFKGYAEGYGEGYAKAFRQSFGERYAERYPKGYAERYPKGYAERYPKGYAERYPKGYAERYGESGSGSGSGTGSPVRCEVGTSPVLTLPGVEEPSVVPKTDERPALTAQARDVFGYWKVKLSPGAKETPARLRAIEARLREGYSVAQLRTVVDRTLEDDHRMGRKDGGKKYIGIDLLYRSADKVDAFSSTAAPAPDYSDNPMAEPNYDCHKDPAWLREQGLADPPGTVHEIRCPQRVIDKLEAAGMPGTAAMFKQIGGGQ